MLDDAKDSVKSYVLENKGGGAGPNFAYAEADRASEAPIAMNVSSIHSEQSITSAHYVNTGKVSIYTYTILRLHPYKYMPTYTTNNGIQTLEVVVTT
jgi:hypothetical protein